MLKPGEEVVLQIRADKEVSGACLLAVLFFRSGCPFFEIFGTASLGKNDEFRTGRCQSFESAVTDGVDFIREVVSRPMYDPIHLGC